MPESPEIAAFGLAVRRRRQQQRLTQTALAAECGISAKQMNNIERGLNLPSLFVYFKICQALGVRLPPFYTFTP